MMSKPEVKMSSTLVVVFDISEIGEPGFHDLLEKILPVMSEQNGPLQGDDRKATFNVYDVSQRAVYERLDKLVEEVDQTPRKP